MKPYLFANWSNAFKHGFKQKMSKNKSLYDLMILLLMTFYVITPNVQIIYYVSCNGFDKHIDFKLLKTFSSRVLKASCLKTGP